MGLFPLVCNPFPYGDQSQDVGSFLMSKDVYPYRPNFKAAVKKLRDDRGMSLAQVAEVMGIELTTLHDYLYKHLHRPGRDPPWSLIFVFS